jgi:hypothetical protein
MVRLACSNASWVAAGIPLEMMQGDGRVGWQWRARFPVD